MAKNEKAALALTASGRQVELPLSPGGDPVARACGAQAAQIARDWIRRGDLAEAVVWLERAGFDGIDALITKHGVRR